jgi:hypothetical protein
MTGLTPRRRLAFPLVAALALLGTACGGGDDDSNDAASGDITTTTVAEATGDPIVVFSSRNVQGGQSSFGPQSYGFVAGLQAQNKRGGIQGRPIQADFCDGHSNANDEKACLQEGFSKGTVVAANSLYRLGDEAKKAWDDAGLTQINNIIVPIPAENPNANLSSVIPGSPSVEASLIMMKELGVKTYIVPTATRTGTVETTQAELDRRKKAGVTQLDPVQVDVTVADMAPTAQALKEKNADMVVLGGLGQANELKLLQAMEAVGYKPKITGAILFTPDDLKSVASIMEGRYYYQTGTLPPDYTDHKEVQRFTAEMEQGQRDGLPWLDKPYTASGHMQGWLTAQSVIAVLEAIPEGEEINAASFTAAAKAAKALDLGGIAAPWTPFEDVDPTTQGKQTYNSFYITTVKGGNLTLLDSKLRCGKLDGCSK